MMHDDMDSKIKDRLLQELIEKMEDVLAGDAMARHKGMSVEVAAPDKEHLKEGLDKAKDVVEQAPEMMGGDKEAVPAEKMPESSEEDDESRLLDLLDSEEKKKDDEE